MFGKLKKGNDSKGLVSGLAKMIVDATVNEMELLKTNVPPGAIVAYIVIPGKPEGENDLQINAHALHQITIDTDNNPRKEIVLGEMLYSHDVSLKNLANSVNIAPLLKNFNVLSLMQGGEPDFSNTKIDLKEVCSYDFPERISPEELKADENDTIAPAQETKPETETQKATEEIDPAPGAHSYTGAQPSPENVEQKAPENTDLIPEKPTHETDEG